MDKDKALRLAREALEHIEWNEAEFWVPRCFWCGGESQDGHKPHCGRQVALNAIDEALNG